MRHNQRMDLDGLREATARAVSESGKTQRQVASELGVTPGAISRALNEANTALAGLQRRIVEHLTGYHLEEEVSVEYIAKRKGGDK